MGSIHSGTSLWLLQREYCINDNELSRVMLPPRAMRVYLNIQFADGTNNRLDLLPVYCTSWIMLALSNPNSIRKNGGAICLIRVPASVRCSVNAGDDGDRGKKKEAL